MKRCKCGKIISFYATRCLICSNKYRKGQKSATWKGGRPKCIDCSKQIKKYSALRCKSCARKEQYKINPDSNPMKGKTPWNYIDGSSGIYPKIFTEQLKESIRKRDNYKCQKCGLKEKNHYRKLDIHHIDYNKENCSKKNLITLCTKCNAIVNTRRNYWKKIFEEIINGKNKDKKIKNKKNT
jgi:hypothetical protein